MKSLVWFFGLILATQSASASINCTEFLKRLGSFQYHRFQSDDGACFLGVDPSNVGTNMVYRSYVLTAEGLLMVFNSYSTEENSTSTGARVFHFFPRAQAPDIATVNGSTHVSFAAPGLSLNLSQDQAKIVSMTGGEVKESSRVSPSNSGGVEFSNVKTVFLDSGFQLGEDPTADSKKNSTFVDPKNRKCQVQNDEIFNYAADGNPELKFSDSELKTFLSSRCPKLQTGF